MATYLELVKKTVRKSGAKLEVPTTVVGADGMLQMFVEWVQEAWKDIQLQHLGWHWRVSRDLTLSIAETVATGTVTLTGGAGGSVDDITVNGVSIMSGAEAYAASLANTATNVAANITAHTSTPNYTAAAVGEVITISPAAGLGDSVNGYAVVSSTTTITSTDVNMAGGVDVEDKDEWALPATLEHFDFRTVSVYDSTDDELPIYHVPYHYWRSQLDKLNRATSTKPQCFTVTPDNKLAFYPPPDQAYTVRYDGLLKVEVFDSEDGAGVGTSDALTPTGIESEYHDAIVWKALEYYAMHFEDGAKLQEAQTMFKPYKKYFEERELEDVTIDTTAMYKPVRGGLRYRG